MKDGGLLISVLRKIWRACCPSRSFEAESSFSFRVLLGRLEQLGCWMSEEEHQSLEFSVSFPPSDNPIAVFVLQALPISPPVINGQLTARDVGTNIRFDIKTDGFTKILVGGAIGFTVLATLFVLLIVTMHGLSNETMPVPWFGAKAELPLEMFFSVAGFMLAGLFVLMSRLGWFLYFRRVKNKCADLFSVSKLDEITNKPL